MRTTWRAQEWPRRKRQKAVIRCSMFRRSSFEGYEGLGGSNSTSMSATQRSNHLTDHKGRGLGYCTGACILAPASLGQWSCQRHTSLKASWNSQTENLSGNRHQRLLATSSAEEKHETCVFQLGRGPPNQNGLSDCQTAVVPNLPNGGVKFRPFPHVRTRPSVGLFSFSDRVPCLSSPSGKAHKRGIEQRLGAFPALVLQPRRRPRRRTAVEKRGEPEDMLTKLSENSELWNAFGKKGGGRNPVSCRAS